MILMINDLRWKIITNKKILMIRLILQSSMIQSIVSLVHKATENNTARPNIYDSINI